MSLSARLAVALIVGVTGPLAMLWPHLRSPGLAAGMAVASVLARAVAAPLFGRGGRAGAGMAVGGALLATFGAAALIGVVLAPLMGAVAGPVFVLARVAEDPAIALIILAGFALAHAAAGRLRRG